MDHKMTDTPKHIEEHINITENNSLAVDILAQETGLSKQHIKQVMQKGAVWLTKGAKTQRLRRAKRTLKKGETLHLYYDKTVLERSPAEPTLLVDEGKYSVWNKPYGLLSQGSKWGDHCTITRWAEQHLTPQRNSFIVHRLDRAATGIIIIAHEKQAAAALSKLFHDRKIDKRYRIQVHGKFGEDTLRIDSDIDERSAVSHFSLINYDETNDQSELDVNIETGRKHQIRRHAAELGFPIVGDRLHGNENDKQDLQLNAYYMRFICPYAKTEKVFDLLKNKRGSCNG